MRIKKGFSTKNVKEPKNLRTAFDTLFSKEIKQLERDILIELYRNGVVHSFYPKSCSIRNDNKGFEILSYGREIFHLNVNPFAELLIKKFRNYILESKKDDNEVKRLNERIKLLVSAQNTDFKKHESNLPRSNTAQTVITTTILVLPPEETSPPEW